MKTFVDKLCPGDLFMFGALVDPKGHLHMCLWVKPYKQSWNENDSRVLVNFGFTRLGQFVIENRDWHDCNVVYVQ